MDGKSGKRNDQDDFIDLDLRLGAGAPVDGAEEEVQEVVGDNMDAVDNIPPYDFAGANFYGVNNAGFIPNYGNAEFGGPYGNADPFGVPAAMFGGCGGVGVMGGHYNMPLPAAGGMFNNNAPDEAPYYFEYGPPAPPKKRGTKKGRAPRYCRICNAEETPLWRKGPDGPQTLCNACGLKHFRNEKKEGE